MKHGQLFLQTYMRLIAPADETHRTGPGTELLCRRGLRGNDLRMQAQTEVGIGIHTQELSLAEAPQCVAWTKPRLSGAHTGDDFFRTFRSALACQRFQRAAQYRYDLIQRHRRRVSPHPQPGRQIVQHVLDHGREIEIRLPVPFNTRSAVVHMPRP